jgi:Arc/MetJ-type ribon-helix-helix transcriptional regulator
LKAEGYTNIRNFKDKKSRNIAWVMDESEGFWYPIGEDGKADTKRRIDQLSSHAWEYLEKNIRKDDGESFKELAVKYGHRRKETDDSSSPSFAVPLQKPVPRKVGKQIDVTAEALANSGVRTFGDLLKTVYDSLSKSWGSRERAIAFLERTAPKWEEAWASRRAELGGAPIKTTAPTSPTVAYRQGDLKKKPDEKKNPSQSDVQKAIISLMQSTVRKAVSFDPEGLDKRSPKFSQKEYDKVISRIVEEMRWEISNAVRKESDWYTKDVQEAVERSLKYLPELGRKSQPEHRDMFFSIAAVLSPLTRPGPNWRGAMIVYGDGIDSDRSKAPQFPLVSRFHVGPKSQGKFGSTQGNSLALINYQIREAWDQHKDIADYEARRRAAFEDVYDWNTSLHTLEEMARLRMAATLENGKKIFYVKPGKFKKGEEWKSHMPSGVAAKRSVEKQHGFFMFGEKVSNFYRGISDGNGVTVEVWMSRGITRSFGQMNDQRRWNDEGTVYGVSAPGDYQNMSKVIKDAVSKYNQKYGKGGKITNSGGQAVMWFFEQGLWEDHGYQKSSKQFYSDEVHRFPTEWRR